MGTQSLFGKKSRFQNPLRQNYRRIASLGEFLGLPEDRFHSVVMFWGECGIKTKPPSNVLTKGTCSSCGYSRVASGWKPCCRTRPPGSSPMPIP